MSGRFEKLFEKKDKNVLNMYCTAGFPALNSTIEVVQSLVQNGADIIELGMPYSDPLADGEVIQHSNAIALQNGITIETLFTQLNSLRNTFENGGIGDATPVVLMGYMNPVLQYGFENFCKQAAAVGVDALILPDLPIFEFESHYASILKKYSLSFIFLVTPQTSEERVKKLDQLSSGFLYAVSSSATTGNNKTVDIKNYLSKLNSYNLKNPVLVGFGIKDKATFTAACAHSNGAIIGTAYIKALLQNNNVSATTQQFLHSILS
jgi:tryptophan synthase alpha chain